MIGLRITSGDTPEQVDRAQVLFHRGNAQLRAGREGGRVKCHITGNG